MSDLKLTDSIDKIQAYWFADVDEHAVLTPDSPVVKRWFGKDAQTDDEINSLFASDLTKARRGKLDEWQETPKGMLSLIILLDQFSRNIYRGSAKAFDTDLKALECSLKSIKSKLDRELTFVERQFIYMPLMHSENIKVQERSLVVFEDLAFAADEADDRNAAYLKSVLQFARNHHAIIKQFDRFPQRNQALGRRSTSSEIQFLRDPKNLF